ncbi:MAG: hypothetical protein OXH60_07815 [Rhodospirillales bacterium]|nr:hypothetical protein [Rhodospirillales bacterium]
MLSVATWDEGLPTLVLIGVGALALVGGYWRGGEVWRRRHQIPINGPESKLRIDGRFGEFAVFTMTLIGVGIVMVSCPDVGLYYAGEPEFAYVLFWFACVFGATELYSWRTVKAADEGNSGGGSQPEADTTDDRSKADDVAAHLKRGYRIYNLYTCVLFGLGGLALAKVALQFRHDWQENASAAQQLVAKAEALLTIQPAVFNLHAIVEVERAYLAFRQLLSDVLVQVEPIAFIFLYVMMMTLLISLTPLSAAFRVGALRLGSAASLCMVVSLLAISLASYFMHAITVSRVLAESLSHMEPWSATDQRHYMRYSEIYQDVQAAGSVTGFIRVLLSEAVFLVIIVGVVQQAATGLRNLAGRTPP